MVVLVYAMQSDITTAKTDDITPLDEAVVVVPEYCRLPVPVMAGDTHAPDAACRLRHPSSAVRTTAETARRVITDDESISPAAGARKSCA